MKQHGHDSETDAATADAGARRQRGTGQAAFALAILFGLFYAFDLFEAISSAFDVAAQLGAYNEFAAAEGLAVAPVPWTLIVANIALPIVVFALATWIGRRRTLGIRALLWFAGLAVVAAVTLSLTAFA